MSFWLYTGLKQCSYLLTRLHVHVVESHTEGKSSDDTTLEKLFVSLLKDFSLHNTVLVIRDKQ